jgi:hypothetical protein
MKRFSLIMLVLLLGVSFTFAEDFGAGVSIGGNLAFLSTEGGLDTLLDDRSPRFGLTAGMYGDYEFHSFKDKIYLSVQPGIFYTMKGFRVDDLKINLDYIEIPVLLKARMPIDAPVDPYFIIGPSLGINIVRESESGNFSISSDDKRADFGIIVGAGVDLEMNFAVDIRANFGLVNIIDSDTRNQNHSVALVASYTIM